MCVCVCVCVCVCSIRMYITVYLYMHIFHSFSIYSSAQLRFYLYVSTCNQSIHLSCPPSEIQ